MDSDLLYVGSFTAPGGDGHGITVTRQLPEGRLTVVGEVPAEAPSFLTFHPRLARLYAVNSVTDGTVTTYEVGDDGTLGQLAIRTSGGANPCHLTVSPDGDRLAVANYADGNVAVYQLDAEGVPSRNADVLTHEGSGPHTDRQDGPHAHFVRYVHGVLHVVDLGADRVHRYVTGDDGRTVAHPDRPVKLRAGSGPRHLVTDGHGSWVVAGELDGTVTSYVTGDDGGWRENGSLPASTSTDDNYPSHIELSADGKLVYVANRGPDTIAVFQLAHGELTSLGEVPTGGSWPRHFTVAGDRLYVANERSHDVTAFTVDQALPEPTGSQLTTPSPGCVLPAR